MPGRACPRRPGSSDGQCPTRRCPPARRDHDADSVALVARDHSFGALRESIGRRARAGSVPGAGLGGTVTFMSAEQIDEPYEVIHIGEHAAAVVPLDDLRRLQARHAPPEAVEAAELEEIAEIRRQTEEWIAAGRPGAVSHEIFRKVLLGEAGA